MNKVVLVDNFDSFVYNIAQYVGEAGADITVLRNNVSWQDIIEREPDRIILSPGPGHPRDSGVTLDVIKHAEVPVLGVCLGHQAIGHIFGAEIVQDETPIHGKTSSISHTGKGIFKDVPSPFTATRYHSLIINQNSVPEELEVIAETESNVIMGIQHKERPRVGLQFHPESILTQGGRKILHNFLEW